MQMKCIYCDKEAKYVLCGFSLCENHTDNISQWDIHSYKKFKKSPLYKRIDLRQNDETRK